MSNTPLDCLIVGAGPAGLTAATYLARFRRHVLVADAGASRARWIPASHNCPGFPFGVAGNELLARFRLQAQTYGVPTVCTRITRLDRSAGGFTASDGERHWHARTLILATGVIDRLPALEGIDEAIGEGTVRLCAVCDAYEARDGVIGVLAPVQRAIEHATFLRTFSRQVCALATDRAWPDEAMQRQASDAGVQLWPAPQRLALVDGACQAYFADGRRLRLDTLYPVLGAQAQSSLAAALGARLDAEGALVVDDHLQTSVPGLHAIGDVVSALNQISVAVGHAAIAATTVHRRLPPNYC
ncbi:MAG: NAD(P)/FAD-dependent oxidoreductase [Frateuria sp.]|uniref:NAD(P)/FAD-dependent oxidoreductase n=1 Tax=Frateuria sp. TaxID=2211372 RepID=UPI0017D6BFFA|nr:NAD(P)/FAD-dependent oxidoreductase [Frateuria sp.]NUO72964.1 NAD(P)/FAD-dependent oxidoreductase [Frateuria sp.]NUR23173.1 NAD(P)/FAD-dependent oxidoreductase [Frateuria sp.]